MAETANAKARQRELIDRFFEKANSINDLQWEGILVRVLRYGLKEEALALVGAITACAKHKHAGVTGFDVEFDRAIRLTGPKVWLQVLQALASREGEEDRVAYFTIAPLYYLTLAIVVEGDNVEEEGAQGPSFKKEGDLPSWWHHKGY